MLISVVVLLSVAVAVVLAYGVLLIWVQAIYDKVGVLMADFAKLKSTLDAIAADVDVIAANPGGPGGGGVVTQAQLDEAVAAAEAIKVKTGDIAGRGPEPILRAFR